VSDLPLELGYGAGRIVRDWLRGALAAQGPDRDLVLLVEKDAGIALVTGHWSVTRGASGRYYSNGPEAARHNGEVSTERITMPILEIVNWSPMARWSGVAPRRGQGFAPVRSALERLRRSASLGVEGGTLTELYGTGDGIEFENDAESIRVVPILGLGDRCYVHYSFG
jgi:hypothetical protein